MFRILDVLPDGVCQVSFESDQVRPPEAGILRWVDLDTPTEGDLELLRERFSFHRLAIENCAQHDQRPKLDEYQTHLFIVTQITQLAQTTPQAQPQPPLEPSETQTPATDILELHAFLGHGYLVTVHAGRLLPLEQAWERCSHAPSPLQRGADFAYYLVADALFDLGFPLLDHLTDEISELEQQMLENPKSSDLKRILQLRGQLAGIRRIVAPQREIVAQLSRQEAAQVSERTSHYLRDVANHLVRLAESIDQCRDRLNGTFEAYISVTSMRTNEIMKSLTLLSAVFLPLTFVVGFFGQNFDTLPWVGDWTHSRGLGNLMVAFCLATPPAMLLWFRAKEWL